ncbi:MAG: hypothetical protein JXA57_00130 [Armatimonadetes bacterium]|nr:hypothetical protein [Armatimonadota bacterium]
MTEQGSVKKKGSPLFLIVVLVLVAVLAVEAYLLARPKPEPMERLAVAEEAIAAGERQQVETFGDPNASTKIAFYAPLVLPWHQETIKLLREYDDEHPGRIEVTLMPMGQPECDATIQQQGHSCAVILINGQNEFVLPDGREVTLEKRPNEPTSSYNSEDVITVLEQLSQDGS